MSQPQQNNDVVETLRAERDLAIGQNVHLRLLASALAECLSDIVTVCGEGWPNMPQLDQARSALEKARKAIAATQPWECK
jgi:hypothetical protein